MKLIECVPNFSEGRNKEFLSNIEAIKKLRELRPRSIEKNQEIDQKSYDEIKSSILKAINSNDFLEGQKAFKEKRSPKFSGK